MLFIVPYKKRFSHPLDRWPIISLEIAKEITKGKLIDGRFENIDPKKIKEDKVFIYILTEQEKHCIEFSKQLSSKEIYFIGPFATLNKKRFEKQNFKVIPNEFEAWFINKTTEIQDLDQLPFPKLTYNYSSFYPTPKKEGFLLTSRGCIHNCNFCTPLSRVSYGKKIRTHSIEYIEKFLKETKKDFIFFMDDNFTFSKKRIKKICKITKRLNIKWGAQGRIDELNKEILKIMADSGCKILKFGTESGSKKILKNMQKTSNPTKWIKDAKELIPYARKLKILTIAMFIVATPWETKKDIELTKDFIKDIKPLLIQVARYTDYKSHNDGHHYIYSKKDKNKEAYLYKSFYLKPTFFLSQLPWLKFYLQDIKKYISAINYILFSTR